MSFQTRLLYSDNNGHPDKVVPELCRFNQYQPKRYPYLLSSTARRQNNAQYDILIACPLSRLILNADKTVHHQDLREGKETISTSSGFLDTLEKLFQQDKRPVSADSLDLPFTGGWFVYLSYEMAEEIEPCLSLPALPENQPLAVAARCPAAIIHDKSSNQLLALAEDKYAYLLDEIEQDYLSLCNGVTGKSAVDENPVQEAPKTIELHSLNESPAEPYLEQIERIKQYIVDGDIFQANLSRQWQATLKHRVESCVLFNALSKQNPSSFAAMACFENISIISSSPERLVSIRNGTVETRPIAGTRARDNNRQSDEALARELLAHPKEQAEHIMLIDLERNDLGRVCHPGSIEVNELMVLESWQHVHHIVSNIRGELEPDKSPIDVLRAVFPGGTITGCPKVRCMEILAEMEQQARGAYTGSLGYINNDGSMDFNILIRTMIYHHGDNENTVTFRAGGGIVSDSIAEKELEETRAKAKGLLNIFKL